VFYGEVLKDELVDDGTFIRYTIKVERTFKGTTSPVEIITSENTSTRWVAEAGERRVVFAMGSKVWGACSPIDEPRRAQETIREILALKKTKRATVEGEVAYEAGRNEVPAKGERIVVKGPGGTFKAVTDRNGRFSMSVPAGRYRLVPPAQFEPSVPYSRRDIGGFDLAPGQCAQFQLTPRAIISPAAPR